MFGLLQDGLECGDTVQRGTNWCGHMTANLLTNRSLRYSLIPKGGVVWVVMPAHQTLLNT